GPSLTSLKKETRLRWPQTGFRMPGYEGGAGTRIVRHQPAVILPLTGESRQGSDPPGQTRFGRLCGRRRPIPGRGRERVRPGGSVPYAGREAEKEGFEPSMEAFTPIT